MYGAIINDLLPMESVLKLDIIVGVNIPNEDADEDVMEDFDAEPEEDEEKKLMGLSWRWPALVLVVIDVLSGSDPLLLSNLFNPTIAVPFPADAEEDIDCAEEVDVFCGVLENDDGVMGKKVVEWWIVVGGDSKEECVGRIGDWNSRCAAGTGVAEACSASKLSDPAAVLVASSSSASYLVRFVFLAPSLFPCVSMCALRFDA